MKIRILFFALLVGGFFAGLYLSKQEDPPTCLADHPSYLQFCEDAASNPKTFEKFKRHPIYEVFNESFSFEEGKQILERLKASFPGILKEDLIERIRLIDHYGAPHVYIYEPYGPLSAETLFHLKIAADVKRIFGDMRRLNIVEIGGGCGSLCKVLHEVFDIETYTMVQLDQENALAQTNLHLLGLDSIQKTPPQKVKKGACDLLISAYGFTESSKKQQIEYMKMLFPGAARGYLICNFLPKHYGIHAFKKQRLLEKLKKIHSSILILPEDPRTGINNCTIIWGHEI